jgi:hypothetical protein
VSRKTAEERSEEHGWESGTEMNKGAEVGEWRGVRQARPQSHRVDSQ